MNMRPVCYLSWVILLLGVHGRGPNSTEPQQAPRPRQGLGLGPRSGPGLKPSWPSGVRRKRSISPSDVVSILDYHNRVRARVFPPAAEMEMMVWDPDLARTAEAWAATCLWEHGPAHLLQVYGQNLSVRIGRYQSILQLVQPWYNEVQDYVFPYPPFCSPRCPSLCFGRTCSHYTQMVWGSSSRLGCAVQTCYNMFVWGVAWREATFLVCNYSPKGNWIGETPYRVGVPCSACRPGATCRYNMCFPALRSNYGSWF